MPLYKYKAADGKSGNAREILIEGDSRQDSLVRLRQRNYIPVEFLGEMSADNGFSLQKLFQAGNYFDPCEFTNRLAPLLKAQIPIERALGITAESMEREKASTLVMSLRKGLHEGKKFSAVIREKGDCFPGYYANMIEAGEESGTLSIVVEELRRFLNERKEMREFLITSSIYPCILISVMVVVIGIIFTVIIPRFTKVFTESGRKLPWATEALMWVAQTAIDLWWFWPLLAAGFAIFVYKIRRGGRVGAWWDKTLLKIPVMGKVAWKLEISRFIRTLAVLIQNHVPLLSAVNISIRIIGNTVISESLAGIGGELRSGTKLSTAIGKSKFIPATAVQMLGIGEETGNMGEMLEQISKLYEAELRTVIRRLLSIFEPVVILVLAAVVFAVVGAIFLAIVEISNMKF